MSRTFTHGGVHPTDCKLTATNNTVILPPPEKAFIPMSQHIGKPAEAVVEKGDMVKVGQLIAKTNGFISANIHSSVSGSVEKIDHYIDSSGYKVPTISLYYATRGIYSTWLYSGLGE